MTIVCIEGASGIGKSTASCLLEQTHGFQRIPEVNELFERPAQESATWYFEKQVERWGLAKAASDAGKVAVLDGDHCQPLWYNWIFFEHGFQPIEAVVDFYQTSIAHGSLGFPDRYFLLSLPVDELRLRKQNDSHRRRRNFEQHLKLISPQQRYFAYLDQLIPGLVQQMNASLTGDVVNAVLAAVNEQPIEYEPNEVIQNLKAYLLTTSPFEAE